MNESISNFCMTFVKGDVTEMVEYILNQGDSAAPFTEDDVENYTHIQCPNIGCLADLDESTQSYDEEEDDFCYTCHACGCKVVVAEADGYTTDVVQWVKVDPKLAQKLLKYHEVVIRPDIWGRTVDTPVERDDVIVKICKELRICGGEKSV